MSHGLDSRLIDAQSQAVEIPLIQWKTTWNTYKHEFKAALRRMKKTGIEGVVVGDIHEIPRHEGWIDHVCNELDLDPIKPLWSHDPRQILSDFINERFEATVIVVKDDILDEKWLGRKIDKNFVKALNKFKGKVDPCGELGEYHTFVTNGPLFKRRIKILESRKVLKNGYWFLDISKYETLAK